MTKRLFIKFVSLLLCFSFLFQQVSFAQGLPLPAVYASSRPPLLCYVSVNSANPFNYFNFLLDKGSSLERPGPDLARESRKLINYFFLGLTLPSELFWVNLRPDQSDRITSEQLSKTDLGRTLLKQDLQLKKDVAKYIHPAHPKGREFWEKLYAAIGKDKARKAEIATSNRVWIIPDQAVVMETGDGAFVVSAKLKVLLENEYLAGSGSRIQNSEIQAISERLMKEVILPSLSDDVNNGPAYGPLRQIYQSLILAEWYKRKLKQGRIKAASNPYSCAINKGGTEGLESELPWSKQAIWQDYLRSYRDGEYKLKDTIFGSRRMYFSGGMTFAALGDSGESDSLISGSSALDTASSPGILEIIPMPETDGISDSPLKDIKSDLLPVLTSNSPVIGEGFANTSSSLVIVKEEREQEASLPSGLSAKGPINKDASSSIMPQALSASGFLWEILSKALVSFAVCASFFLSPIDAFGLSKADKTMRQDLAQEYVKLISSDLKNHYRRNISKLNKAGIQLSLNQLIALELAETDGEAVTKNRKVAAIISSAGAVGPLQITPSTINDLNKHLLEPNREKRTNKEPIALADAKKIAHLERFNLSRKLRDISWNKIAHSAKAQADMTCALLAINWEHFNGLKLVVSYDRLGNAAREFIPRKAGEENGFSVLEAVVASYNAGQKPVEEALIVYGPQAWKKWAKGEIGNKKIRIKRGMPRETINYVDRFLSSLEAINKTDQKTLYTNRKYNSMSAFAKGAKIIHTDKYIIEIRGGKENLIIFHFKDSVDSSNSPLTADDAASSSLQLSKEADRIRPLMSFYFSGRQPQQWQAFKQSLIKISERLSGLKSKKVLVLGGADDPYVKALVLLGSFVTSVDTEPELYGGLDFTSGAAKKILEESAGRYLYKESDAAGLAEEFNFEEFDLIVASNFFDDITILNKELIAGNIFALLAQGGMLLLGPVDDKVKSYFAGKWRFFKEKERDLASHSLPGDQDANYLVLYKKESGDSSSSSLFNDSVFSAKKIHSLASSGSPINEPASSPAGEEIKAGLLNKIKIYYHWLTYGPYSEIGQASGKLKASYAYNSKKINGINHRELRKEIIDFVTLIEEAAGKGYSWEKLRGQIIKKAASDFDSLGGISKTKLAQYLGISRPALYGYLEELAADPNSQNASSPIKIRDIKPDEEDEYFKEIEKRFKEDGIEIKVSADSSDLENKYVSLGIGILSLFTKAKIADETFDQALEFLERALRSHRFRTMEVEPRFFMDLLIMPVTIKKEATILQLEKGISKTVEGLIVELKKAAGSPAASDKNEGGIDLSGINLILKDEAYIFSLNPAELKVLRAAGALGSGQESLSLLYVHEIMLLLKDNLVDSLSNIQLLQNVLQQLQIKSFLDPQAIKFFNSIQSCRPISEIKLTLSKQ
jgi:hypothetical protein